MTLLAGRYEPAETIGRGAAGRVVRARDVVTDRDVALKFPEGAELNPKRLARLRREAHLAGQLSHPGIVAILDVCETDAGEPFIVMEYVEGNTLASVLEAGRPSLEQTLRIALQVARALRSAHASGLVHRDVKPSNVIVTVDEDGEAFAKLLDFGVVAPLAATAEPITADGTIVGTPGYISPEQALGNGANPSSDIYSFGVMLYEMLAGRLPFNGSPLRVIQAHMQTPAPPLPAELALPPRLVSLVMRCMEKLPEDRIASAVELVSELRTIAQVESYEGPMFEMSDWRLKTLPGSDPNLAPISDPNLAPISDPYLAPLSDPVATPASDPHGIPLTGPQTAEERAFADTQPLPTPAKVLWPFVVVMLLALGLSAATLFALKPVDAPVVVIEEAPAKIAPVEQASPPPPDYKPNPYD